MSQIVDEVIAANKKYASGFGAKKDLALPPARGFAILTCMDARLDPAKFAGLAEGDAHVIRNAGGRASDDAVRSLVISHKLLGTREWFVIHHTNCGMELFNGEIIGGSQRIASFDLLKRRIEEHNLPLDAFQWYLDLRRYGSVPHSGFGMGIERAVAWICGLEHVRETIPFARTLNRIYP